MNLDNLDFKFVTTWGIPEILPFSCRDQRRFHGMEWIKPDILENAVTICIVRV